MQILLLEFKKIPVSRNKRLIAEKMADTFLIRRNYVLKANPTQHDFFKNWPALLQIDEVGVYSVEIYLQLMTFIEKSNGNTVANLGSMHIPYKNLNNITLNILTTRVHLSMVL